MRYLITTLLFFSSPLLYGQDTTVRKPISLYRKLQIEVGAAAGFVFPGATESTLPNARAFRGGMFLFKGNVNFNYRHRALYITTGLYTGLMPFSTWGSIPSTSPPYKPVAEYRNDYLVAGFALVPGLQAEIPAGNRTRICAGIGVGGMLQAHGYQHHLQKNILLEASVGILADDMTAVGLRFYHTYNGLEEYTAYYANSYMLTGILLDFRQRLSRNGQKK